MLKPAGTLSLASGSLSACAGIGGGATGASLAAASPSGRPIRGDPGGSGWAAGAAPAAGAAAGCCAAADNVNAPKKAPASNMLRDADEIPIMEISPKRKPSSRRRRAGGFSDSQSVNLPEQKQYETVPRTLTPRLIAPARTRPLPPLAPSSQSCNPDQSPCPD